MRNGFTLVELSIVLVIIGLLVGGILVGQSLIESAKISRLVRDIQQYEVMVDQFDLKFRSLPGDNSLFPVAGRGTAVANDGLIAQSDNTGYEAAVTASYDSEVAHFWQHLSQAGIANQNYTANTGIEFDSIVPGVNAPSVFEDMPLFLITVEQRSSGGSTSPMANFFGIGGALTTPQALAFDVKMDDGYAGTLGSIILQSFNLPFLSKEVVGINTTGACQTSGTLPIEYNMAISGEVCLVLIGFERK